MGQTKKGEAAAGASDATIPLVQLQADIGDLVEQARALVRASAVTLAKSTAKRAQNQFADLESRLLRERKNVASLELRLAVVAPMKAGKSTIINGLLGREILPFRSAAMTTLPTEVVLTPSGGEPRLLLSPEMLEAIQNAEVDLRELLRHVDRGVLKKLLASNPDCEKVVECLRSNTAPLLSAQTDHTRIRDTLLWINDLNRLCALLKSEAAVTAAISGGDVARVEAPLSALARDLMRFGSGRLVLIDTPGPDEWENDAFLERVVEVQLAHCSGVVLVLNFTALNNSAAGALKEKVMKTIAVTSEKNLVVVVNRIDQRKSNHDMSTEEVRDFVRSHLGVKIDAETAIFETSAAWAFAAANYLGERARRPDASAEQLTAFVDSVLKEIFPIDWESMKEELTLEALDKRARSLWDKSGFHTLFDRAVARFSASAGEVCLRTALDVTSDVLKRVRQELDLRSVALQADAATLKKAIADLERQAGTLRSQRKTLIDKVHLKRVSMKKRVAKALEQMWEGTGIRESDLVASNGDPLPFLPRTFIAKARGKKKMLAFTSEKQAKEAVGAAIAHGQKKVGAVLRSKRNDLLEIIKSERDALHHEAVANARPIVERAAEQLGRQLDVRLDLPEYTPPPVQLPEVTYNPDAVSVTHAGKSRTVRVYERSWRRFWLWKSWYEKTVVDPDREVTEYHVTLDRLIKAVNESGDEFLRFLEEELQTFISDQLGASLDDYLSALQEIVDGFLANLQSAKEQKEGTVEEQESIASDLCQNIAAAEQIEQRCTELATLVAGIRERRVV
ncbi:MAG: hypothetical protein QOI58_30 [Thermoanaerobaculia bacterium]|jgi:GTPase SAR1 family protein|nr:hypothetical protein [Thermoanaerobaculia bacterium]